MAKPRIDAGRDAADEGLDALLKQHNLCRQGNSVARKRPGSSSCGPALKTAPPILRNPMNDLDRKV
jgi:hypothetical protein